jgi:predicted RNase H-like nuclease (RuvC/YqgF family)
MTFWVQLALSDLLIAKKSDYDRMKDHCGQTIGELEDEVQRLKSEKARLIDRLQLPESERASLAAEENEIAELKRRLEDAEMRYSDALADNEDLRQEVDNSMCWFILKVFCFSSQHSASSCICIKTTGL